MCASCRLKAMPHARARLGEGPLVAPYSSSYDCSARREVGSGDAQTAHAAERLDAEQDVDDCTPEDDIQRA